MKPAAMFKSAFTTWELQEDTIKLFTGGWIARVRTDRGEERFVLWLGSRFVDFSLSQAPAIEAYLQQKGVSNVR